MPLERVTDGLFDYAGMFPPAALSFEEALRESAHFPSTLGEPELVAADIVLTPKFLDQLNSDSLREASYAGRPCRICLVGVPASDAVAMANKVREFNLERASEPVVQKVISLEVHFEDESFEDVLGAMNEAQAILDDRVQLFLEPKWDDARLKAGMTAAFELLDAINAEEHHVGFKARCAGPNALSHNTLAHVIARVNHRSIPLKLTQGLHHAFAADPRFDNQHGFLNCVFGIRLHRDANLEIEELAACLADDDPSNFVWDQGIGWRNHRISMQNVVESAVSVPFSIGSCSLAEPDAELKELQ